MQLDLQDPSGRILKSGTVSALIFDLDGVLTRTAELHAQAWKITFDDFLKRWSTKMAQPQAPFSIETDYRAYVDGRIRSDGVSMFLKSRGIELPLGSKVDPIGTDTISTIGERKNRLFLDMLRTQGVHVFEDAAELLKAAKRSKLKTAVVTASKNCNAILHATGLGRYFDVRIDGVTAAVHHLKGKPEPDTFLAAAAELGVTPASTAIFEDATSGVQAGRRGGFGWVIGVARSGPEEDLAKSGADFVIRSFAQIRIRPPVSRVLEPFA